MSPHRESEVALSVDTRGISARTFIRLQRINWLARAEAAKYRVKPLARDCGISVRQLQRFFKMHFRKSPKQWVRAIRVDRALQLLRRGYSVKEVAGILHFSDIFHFSKRFSGALGFPPSTVASLLNNDPEAGPAEHRLN